jgi:hypothetical protein
MTQKFYEEIGSMSEKQAKKLMALFDKDPHTKKMMEAYFKDEPFKSTELDPGEQFAVTQQAIQYLRHQASL